MYVVTFYSYKGGVGRTLALLNVAYEMADSGLRVLVVDFDLEAPSIQVDGWKRPNHENEVEAVNSGSDHHGAVEFVSEYLTTMRVPMVADYVLNATPKGCNGEIALLPSGIPDDTYVERLSKIDWNDLYAAHDGYVMFEDLRAQWEGLGFDYVLLNSRTGLTDIAGICTRHLPDAVVTMFRPDDQSLGGTVGVVHSIRREKPTPRRRESIVLHFVMAGIPDADDEHGILDARRRAFQEELKVPPRQLLEVRQYQSMDLLTQPIYTDIRRRTKLAAAFQELTRRIRARNVQDRHGVFVYLRRAIELPDEVEENYLRRIGEHYKTDLEVAGELAGVHYSRGSILDSADLLERIAESGSPTPEQLLHLAEIRHTARNEEGTIGALRSFFLRPRAELQPADQPRITHVLRGLSLLEVLGADRTAYVRESPTVQGLSAQTRGAVAAVLDLNVEEQRIGIQILEELLHGVEESPDRASDWEWQLAFLRISVGQFGAALVDFRSLLEKPGTHRLVPTAFNLAMAHWATTGIPDKEAFLHVLALLDAEEDKTWIDGNASALQAVAVAAWFGDRVDAAYRYLERARELVRGTHREISCWSYTRVSHEVFLAHCDEIRRLFAGEDVKPEFMRLADCDQPMPRE